MSGDPPSVEEELRALRLAYGAELPKLLRELLAELEAARANPAAEARAHRKAHRIRGTAGTHGFVEASAIAGEIEDAIDEGRGVPPEVEAALARLLAAGAAGEGSST